ncbi:hypothetical protein [Burkholderia cepacia]|uniref:hypothetical protein n=1 Tax=Burkholderia cepacia TaxID=292 RepID=UPI0021474697|nr:hypothetical protein [Burkholderia cepacia]
MADGRVKLRRYVPAIPTHGLSSDIVFSAVKRVLIEQSYPKYPFITELGFHEQRDKEPSETFATPLSHALENVISYCKRAHLIGRQLAQQRRLTLINSCLID